jgi:hypothetical protein
MGGIPDGFTEWWQTATKKLLKEQRSRFHSMVILCTWRIWKQQNICVFERAVLSVHTVTRLVLEEVKPLVHGRDGREECSLLCCTDSILGSFFPCLCGANVQLVTPVYI